MPGIALGMVQQLPDSDQTSVSRRQLLAHLDVCMGGRVAEELIFGAAEVTTGASSDLDKVCACARMLGCVLAAHSLSRTVRPVEGASPDVIRFCC